MLDPVASVFSSPIPKSLWAGRLPVSSSATSPGSGRTEATPQGDPAKTRGNSDALGTATRTQLTVVAHGDNDDGDDDSALSLQTPPSSVASALQKDPLPSPCATHTHPSQLGGLSKPRQSGFSVNFARGECDNSGCRCYDEGGASPAHIPPTGRVCQSLVPGMQHPTQPLGEQTWQLPCFTQAPLPSPPWVI